MREPSRVGQRSGYRARRKSRILLVDLFLRHPFGETVQHHGHGDAGTPETRPAVQHLGVAHDEVEPVVRHGSIVPHRASETASRQRATFRQAPAEWPLVPVGHHCGPLLGSPLVPKPFPEAAKIASDQGVRGSVQSLQSPVHRFDSGRRLQPVRMRSDSQGGSARWAPASHQACDRVGGAESGASFLVAERLPSRAQDRRFCARSRQSVTGLRRKPTAAP
jgi:hypothetical protein